MDGRGREDEGPLPLQQKGRQFRGDRDRDGGADPDRHRDPLAPDDRPRDEKPRQAIYRPAGQPPGNPVLQQGFRRKDMEHRSAQDAVDRHRELILQFRRICPHHDRPA